MTFFLTPPPLLLLPPSSFLLPPPFYLLPPLTWYMRFDSACWNAFAFIVLPLELQHRCRRLDRIIQTKDLMRDILQALLFLREQLFGGQLFLQHDEWWMMIPPLLMMIPPLLISIDLWFMIPSWIKYYKLARSYRYYILHHAVILNRRWYTNHAMHIKRDCEFVLYMRRNLYFIIFNT